MKYGFEREFFVKNRLGEYVEVVGLPKDDCGFLAEARGVPDTSPIIAAHLLLAEEHRIKLLAKTFDRVDLVIEDVVQLSPEFKRKLLKTYGKSPVSVERGNMYGRDYSLRDFRSRAGLHVHFSNFQTVSFTIPEKTCNRCGHSPKQKEVPGIINMPKYILALDKAFAAEIKAAQRLPGFFEMKPHGFEYRSLPASIDVLKVAEVLHSLK